MRTGVTENTGRSIAALKKKWDDHAGKRKRGLRPQQEEAPSECFQTQVREEQETCDRAVQRLREGAAIVIDWTTRSNFRVRESAFPKVRTEPAELSVQRRAKGDGIELRRKELARLLHEKNKKFYMKSRSEQEEEAELFGFSHKEALRKLHVQRAERRLMQSKERRFSEVKQTIESAQQELMENCKLEQLREELKFKFQEIRELYNRSSTKRRLSSKAPS